jgi:DNA-binding IclR family transcriptional regulator
MRKDASGSDKEPKFKSLVPALEQGIRILLFLRQHASEKMSLTKICQALGIHNSKGHYILSTLQQYALVDKDSHSKTYMLGPGLIPLARSVLDHLDFRGAAAPVVEELAKQVSATVWFGLRMSDSFFVLNKYEEAGEHFLGYTRDRADVQLL